MDMKKDWTSIFPASEKGRRWDRSDPLHDQAGEPAGNKANKRYDQQAFARHMQL
jgi:hypothetical protein